MCQITVFYQCIARHISGCVFSYFRRSTNSGPSSEGTETIGFLYIPFAMQKMIQQSNVEGLKWAQVNWLCDLNGIGYQSTGSKRNDTSTKKDALPKSLPITDKDAWQMWDNVWSALLKAEEEGKKWGTWRSPISWMLLATTIIWAIPKVHRRGILGNLDTGSTLKTKL